MMMSRLKSFFLDIVEVVVFSIAIFLFIYLLVLQPHKIKGASMEPNLPNGEYLLTDKVTYRLREPQRGDIIVFEPPAAQGEEFIKRIIATPGETVSLKEGKVFIDGKSLIETYLAQDIKTSPGIFLKDGQEVRVPPENYLVLGDNRPFSSDSRAWGFVTKDKITGRAWLIYWPLSEAGVVEEIVYNLN
ncbi:signal peptidase I [Patescibacteria group bacterium]|nr:signal peptidase I [Patescibacteria group bacterium]